MDAAFLHALRFPHQFVEGQIEEIGTVKTTLLTEEGELVSISNRILLEQHVTSR